MLSNQNGPITIRPNRRVNAAKILAIEALVMPASIASMLHGDIGLKAIGSLFLLFFGVGGIFELIMIACRDWSLVLTDAGIEMNATNAYSRRALIRWEDIEEINVIQIHSVKMVGIRLFSYDNYLKSLDVEKVRFIEKITIALTRTMKLLKTVNTADASDIKLTKKLDAWNGVNDIRGLLEGNRAVCGYDISFGNLDRSPEKLADFLRASLEAAMAKQRCLTPISASVAPKWQA
jgi:hypothetical protein